MENARTFECDKEALPKEASGTSDQEALRRTAIHEAGHALASCAMKRKFRYVTIIPNEDSRGHVLHSRLTVSRCRDLIYGSSNWWWRRMETEKEIVMRLAGGIAQAIVFGDHESSDPDDLGRMTDGGTWGKELIFVMDLAEKLTGSREQALFFVRWMMVRTHDMLLFPINRVLLDVIANELLAHKTLSYAKVRRIISTAERYVRKEIRKKKEEARKKKNARDTKSDDLTLEERRARFTDILATGTRRTLEAKYGEMPQSFKEEG